MKLQRFQPGLEWPQYPEDGDYPSPIMEPDDGEWCDEGKWYKADEVDAMIAAILAAINGEGVK